MCKVVDLSRHNCADGFNLERLSHAAGVAEQDIVGQFGLVFLADHNVTQRADTGIDAIATRFAFDKSFDDLARGFNTGDGSIGKGQLRPSCNSQNLCRRQRVIKKNRGGHLLGLQRGRDEDKHPSAGPLRFWQGTSLHPIDVLLSLLCMHIKKSTTDNIDLPQQGALRESARRIRQKGAVAYHVVSPPDFGRSYASKSGSCSSADFRASPQPSEICLK